MEVKENTQNQSPQNWTEQALTNWFQQGEWKQGWKIKIDDSTDKAAFAKAYFQHPNRWNIAFNFLAQTNLSAIEVGKYELDGKNVFAMVSEYQSKNESDAKLEAHADYADIQYVISGEENIGVIPLSQTEVTEPYNPNKDIVFLKSDNIVYHHATNKTGFLFFPNDAHRPCVAIQNSTPVRKVVIKIRLVE